MYHLELLTPLVRCNLWMQNFQSKWPSRGWSPMSVCCNFRMHSNQSKWPSCRLSPMSVRSNPRMHQNQSKWPSWGLSPMSGRCNPRMHIHQSKWPSWGLLPMSVCCNLWMQNHQSKWPIRLCHYTLRLKVSQPNPSKSCNKYYNTLHTQFFHRCFCHNIYHQHWSCKPTMVMLPIIGWRPPTIV